MRPSTVEMGVQSLWHVLDDCRPSSTPCSPVAAQRCPEAASLSRPSSVRMNGTISEQTEPASPRRANSASKTYWIAKFSCLKRNQCRSPTLCVRAMTKRHSYLAAAHLLPLHDPIGAAPCLRHRPPAPPRARGRRLPSHPPSERNRINSALSSITGTPSASARCSLLPALEPATTQVVA